MCYQNGKKQTIKQQDFKNGETPSLQISINTIVFVLKGRVRISVPIINESVTLGADQLVFLPAGTRIDYTAIEPGTMFFLQIDNLTGKIPECKTFRFQRDSNTMQFEESRGLYPLCANRRIKHALQGLIGTESDGFKCGIYANLIVGQLLFLIQVYYRQAEYSRFYSTVLSPDVQLSDFVYANWKKYPTANEMADAFGMSVQQFSIRFRKVFGEAPGGWIRRRKAEVIYYDLCSSEKALKNIAQEYGFSMPNFVRYCRDNYDSTPGAIRERLNSELGCSSCSTQSA
jgi:AraC-like DNA-binding protein